MPALNADAAVRDAFFVSLADVENRRHEPWVLEARLRTCTIPCAPYTPSATSAEPEPPGDPAYRRHLLPQGDGGHPRGSLRPP
jgi:hypothetical protein